jgi:hypothetical protein
MKKTLFISFILVLFFIFASWYNSVPQVVLSRLLKNGGIRQGQLHYRVYFMKIFPMGDAYWIPEDVEDYHGQAVYHLSITANSLKAFSKIAYAHAALESYIHIRELTPALFREKIVFPGNKEFAKEIFYDQENQVMTKEGERRKIMPNTHDPLSAMFNLRRIDFDKTANVEININTNQKNYVLKGTANSSGVSLHGNTYKLARLEAEISRREQNPYHKSRINVVLLKEGGNIPLTASVFSRGLFISARLIGIK